MSGLAERILSRFPAHMEAGDPGKQLFNVVIDMAVPLEVLAVDVGEVRRAHRLGDAQVLTDALRVAAFLRLARSDFEVLAARFERARALVAELEGAGGAAERDQAAEALCDLWGLGAKRPRLPLFDPEAADLEQADPERAAKSLAAAAREQLTLGRRIDAIERRVEEAASIHAAGNGTVSSLLRATANALDLEVTGIFHSADRFWHAATAEDRLPLVRRVVTDDGERRERLTPVTEVIGIEENPRRRVETGAFARRHAELFTTLRKGFETARLQVRITGVGDRTFGPMLVNRDQGRGIGFSGRVPDGETLVVTEEGRALLGGTDVTAHCYAWEGGCFAAADAAAGHDFVLTRADGTVDSPKPATFARATPAGALAPEAGFPHAGFALPVPDVAVGETRFALFAGVAHFGAGAEPGAQRVAPRPFVGLFDRSLFAARPAGSGDPAARVELSWLENEAYAVRVLVPKRFEALVPADAAAGAGEGFRRVPEIVATALGPFKPAGVHVRVEFVDPRWVLGRGVLAGEVEESPIENVRSGIHLWAAEAG